MNTETTNIGRGFWLRWVLATIAGFIAGMVLGLFVAYSLFDREVFDATLGVTMGLVMGATAGCLH